MEKNININLTGPKNKFLRFPIVQMFIALILVVAGFSIIKSLLTQIGTHFQIQSTIWFKFLAMIITIALIHTLYFYYVTFIEKRPVLEFGKKSALKELGVGALIGFVLFVVAIGLIWIFGYYHVSDINPFYVLIAALVSGLLAGYFEELLFRVIIFQKIEKLLGTWLALAIIAILFGLMHAGNKNASLLSTIALILEAGILLTASYMFTRRLWLAMGLHAAWNFTQNGIFGVTVSGSKANGIFVSELSGPNFISGGTFGAEASIFAVIICLVVGVYFIKKSYDKGNIFPPAWRRSS
ncbi:CPBP family intramembrane metalloprotease [candidate division KSB1 bacterium]|nr:CPBP family intramembrane metalloprotease [candidate division KSB1 bacterium]